MNCRNRCRCRVARLFGLAFCLALFGLSGPSSAEPRLPRIANGVTTTDQPTVGALLFGASDRAICSGTLIGCRTFLTAAHCVCDENGSTCDPTESEHRVFLQHGTVYSVSQITPNPTFIDFPAAANDIAIVTLAGPVDGFAPTPIATLAPPFGSSGTVAGFGNLDDDPRTGAGIKREGAVVTTGCSFSGAPDSQFVCWDPMPPFGPPGTDSNACPGDSGGPLFVESGGETVVAGAISFGLGPCAGDDFSGSANVATYASWIQSVAGADLTATCGPLPPVGDPAVQVTGFEDVLIDGSDSNLHTFEVPEGVEELRITLNGIDDGAEDFDLWVRFGAPPEAGLNDCASESVSQLEVCRTVSPPAGTWYALARSVGGGGPYQVTVTQFGAPPTCGDGVITGAETCDDGNTISGDGCDASCQIETVCGDGVVEGTETCDDGNTVAGDGCDATCQTEVPTLGCAAAPEALCTALPTGTTSLKLKRGSKPGKDRLQWSWKAGKNAVADLSELSDADYHLCVYGETADTPALVFQTSAPAGPLWTEKRKSFRFRGIGEPGTLEQLKIGLGSRFKLTAKAREIPSLPLAQDTGVVAQLRNDRGRCFEARYDAPAKKNDDRRFSDKVKQR